MNLLANKVSPPTWFLDGNRISSTTDWSFFFQDTYLLHPGFMPLPACGLETLGFGLVCLSTCPYVAHNFRTHEKNHFNFVKVVGVI